MEQPNRPVNENEHTYDNGFHPKEVVLKENYHFYNRNFFFRIVEKTLIFFTRIWLLVPRMVMGIKIIGRKNKRKVKGAIMICNHIHQFDAFFLVATTYFQKVYVTMLQSNLGFGIASRYMRYAAAVPIPTDRRLLRKFNEETKKTLERKDNILFYPEASLVPFCDHIRHFLPGAFHYAVVNHAPIIPCCYTFHQPKGIRKLYRKKPVLHLTFLDPYDPPSTQNRANDIETATREVHDLIEKYFIEHSDYYYQNGQKIRNTFTKEKKNDNI